MQKIKIGVLDKEREYVTKLAAYLQQYGKGKWDLSAFTDEKLLNDFLEKRMLDILVGTDRRSLLNRHGNRDLTRLWLADEKGDYGKKEDNFHTIYRFQSTEEIAKCIAGIVKQQQKCMLGNKQMVALYSPVGRCGKTSLALDVVKNRLYGKWLYVGMEDYSSFVDSSQKVISDEFLYYWKEHREEKLQSVLEQVEDVLVTGTSYFDVKQMETEDITWFQAVLQKTDYIGAIFDIGSGVMKSFQMLQAFDVILVPYLEEETARIKKGNFKGLFLLQ